ncbi:hypothetical protein ACFVRB_13130 [Streptomyces nojiriensis]|uniref:hypothetical protein n=1 Tax=Streptomyces nojiriensis TaxID=66374 RepID=UPI0036DB64C8
MNAHLTALDRFFSQLSLGPAVRRRADAPKLAPRTLDARQQKRYLRAVERRPLARDRAIRRLLFHSGVRIAELVALDDDVPPVPAEGQGHRPIRQGRDLTRDPAPGDGTARVSVTEWRTERASWPGAADSPALLLNRRGSRLTTRSVQLSGHSPSWPASSIPSCCSRTCGPEPPRRWERPSPPPPPRTPQAPPRA